MSSEYHDLASALVNRRKHEKNKDKNLSSHPPLSLSASAPAPSQPPRRPPRCRSRPPAASCRHRRRTRRRQVVPFAYLVSAADGGNRGQTQAPRASSTSPGAPTSPPVMAKRRVPTTTTQASRSGDKKRLQSRRNLLESTSITGSVTQPGPGEHPRRPQGHQHHLRQRPRGGRCQAAE